MRRRRPFCRILLLSAGLAAVGCRAGRVPPALDRPVVRLESSAVVGAGPDGSPATVPAATRPAGGPTAGAGAGAVGVDITWAVIARVPPDALDPLDARATLTSAPLAGGAVLTSGRQTAAARFGEGTAVDDLLKRLVAQADGPVEQVGHQAGVVPPGTTTTFRFSATAGNATAAGKTVTLAVRLSPPAAPVTTPSVEEQAAFDAATDAGRGARIDPLTRDPTAAAAPATTPSAAERTEFDAVLGARRGPRIDPPTGDPLAATGPTTAGAATATKSAAGTQPATTPQSASTRPATARPTTQPATPPFVAVRPHAGSPGSRPAGPVSRPTAVGSIDVTLEGFRDVATAGDDTPATRPAITATPETAYLTDVPLAPGDRYALVIPCRFDGLPWRGVVALIDITEPPADAGEIVDAQLGRRAATGPSTMPAAEQTLRRATDALRTAKDPRASLLFLATATRAAIAADAILVADASTLDRLRSHVLQFTKDHDAADAAALGWHLDRTAVLTLCDAAAANTLPAELAAVLVLHGGEVGRHADAMAEAAKGVGSAADLNARLVGENTIALEDNAPAARVRAFDWLKAQGRAPADYDPLGDARERRAAINRAISTTQGAR